MAKDLKSLLARKLAENSRRHAAAHQEVDIELGRRYEKIGVDLIEPNPYQPRQLFPDTELESLARSIQEAGLLQPISVRSLPDGRFQLIAGERRLRACKLLGRSTIESLIFPMDDGEMAVLALAENMDRADLSDFEIGQALRQIENLFPTKKKLAETLGLNREDMYRFFAFEALPREILTQLSEHPRLLARAAAVALRRLLQGEQGEQAREQLLTLWPRLVCGELDQTRLVQLIEQRLQEKTKNPPPRPQADLFDKDGKTVGSIVRAPKKLTITLKASALLPEQEANLIRFLEQLLSEQV